jgi:hypothetical protein
MRRSSTARQVLVDRLSRGGFALAGLALVMPSLWQLAQGALALEDSPTSEVTDLLR